MGDEKSLTIEELKDLYTIEDLSNLLNLSTRTIRRRMSEGKINYQYVGNKIMFTKSDINQYLDSIKKH